ncbi:hypothetical protein FQZ97_1130150 [compost metagenome]
MEDLGDIGIAEKLDQIGRLGGVLWDLHDVGAAIAGRELHDAEPVTMRIEPHGLGIDGDLAAIARKIRQVAAVQSDGHVRSLKLSQISSIPDGTAMGPWEDGGDLRGLHLCPSTHRVIPAPGSLRARGQAPAGIHARH